MFISVSDVPLPFTIRTAVLTSGKPVLTVSREGDALRRTHSYGHMGAGARPCIQQGRAITAWTRHRGVSAVNAPNPIGHARLAAHTCIKDGCHHPAGTQHKHCGHDKGRRNMFRPHEVRMCGHPRLWYMACPCRTTSGAGVNTTSSSTNPAGAPPHLRAAAKCWASPHQRG